MIPVDQDGHAVGGQAGRHGIGGRGGRGGRRRERDGHGMRVGGIQHRAGSLAHHAVGVQAVLLLEEDHSCPGAVAELAVDLPVIVAQGLQAGLQLLDLIALGAVADDRRRRGRVGVDGHSHHVAVNRLGRGGQAHFHLGQIHQARHAHRHHYSRDQQHRCCHQPDNLLRIYAALAAGRPLIHHFYL